MAVIPAQLRHGRWVILNTGEKKYIADVDLNGEISPVGHFSVYLVDQPGASDGEWVGTERIQSVKGANPDVNKSAEPVNLGIASWQANKAGSIAEYIIQVPQGFRVIGKKSGRNFGTYPTEKLAKARMRQMRRFREEIKIPVDKGDTVLVGKFKNKPIKVTDIGKDNYDMPTINGRKAVTFRMKKDEAVQPKYEIWVKNTWHEVSSNVFRSWGGQRRLDGKEFKGPVFYWLSKNKAKNEAYQGMDKCASCGHDRSYHNRSGCREIKHDFTGKRPCICKGFLEPKNEEKFNKLIGGKGDNTDSDSVDPNQFKVGIEVEYEHCKDWKIAAEITLDHLTENPNYYTELIDTGIADEKDAITLAKQTGVSKKENIAPNKCRCGHSRAEHQDLDQSKVGSLQCSKCDCDEFQNLKEGDASLHHAKPAPMPAKPSGDKPTKSSGPILDVFTGIDEPPKLAELVDDAEVLVKIDKLRKEISKLQKIPSTDAYGVHKKVLKMQAEISALEKQLYSELNLDEAMKSLTQLVLEAEEIAVPHYSASDKTFSVELSSTKLSKVPKEVYLKNPKTGSKVLFKMFATDKDASGEDIYGYWFKSVDGQYKLLIVND